MLYSFYGTDIARVRTLALKKLGELRHEGGEVVIIPSHDDSLGMLKDALGATSLFGSGGLYLLDTPSESSEFFVSVIEVLSELRDSANAFVLIEGPLKAADEKKIEKESTEAHKIDGGVKKDFNVFALSDALLARDKKTLWILLQESWQSGRTSEELIGTLFWQMKILRLSEIAKSAEESGQKPFVFDKAKRALKNFKPGEVATLSQALVLLYHEGHGGTRNIDHALEEWILGL
jgi:DNA polymerase III delta subunit